MTPERNRKETLIAIVVFGVVGLCCGFCLFTLALINDALYDQTSYGLAYESFYIHEEFPFLVRETEWTLEDHFLISDSIHQVRWGELPQKWRVRDAEFTKICSDTNDGYFESDITYYKKKLTSIHFSETVIEKQAGFITLGTRELEPYYLDFWISSFRWDRLAIQPERAMQIAEQNGGKEFREMVNNSCTVRLFLAPWSLDYAGWQIMYYEYDDYEYRERGDNSLIFYIDPRDGKVVDKFEK